MVYVGEFGLQDPIPFTKGQYVYLTENHISFAVYAINSSSDNTDALIAAGKGVTDRGNLAVEYWNSPE